MSDGLISKEALFKKIDKIKVSSAEIVVHGTKEKPYYEIKYFDLSDNETHIGFSSYKLDVVFGYFEKYFDIVNKENKPEHSQNHIIGDLISRKAAVELVIAEYDKFQANGGSHSGRHELDKVIKMLQNMATAFDKEKVIADLAKCKESAEEIWSAIDSEQDFGETMAYMNAIRVVEKGGIE